jgi:hypothetical protein
MQAGLTLAQVAHDPHPGSLAGDAQFFGHMRTRAAIDHDALHEQASSMHGQTGITVTHREPPV